MKFANFGHGGMNNPDKLLIQKHLYINWVNEGIPGGSKNWKNKSTVSYGWSYCALADHSDSAGHTIQQMDDETGFKADLKLAAAV